MKQKSLTTSWLKSTILKLFLLTPRKAYRLETEGYIVISNIPLFLSKFYANLLGTVIHESEIITKKSSKKFADNHSFFELHSDDPNANFVLLYCKNTSDKGGDTLLFDLDVFFSQLSQEELNEFELMKTYVPPIKLKIHNDNIDEEFIISDNGYYFLPWREIPTFSEKQQLLFNKLRNYVRDNIKIQFLLKEKDLVIINNKRMLHGRTEIVEVKKKRCIVRYLVKK